MPVVSARCTLILRGLAGPDSASRKMGRQPRDAFGVQPEHGEFTPLAALYVLILWNRGRPTRAGFWEQLLQEALLLSRSCYGCSTDTKPRPNSRGTGPSCRRSMRF